jgi:L-threonylcarbamoyladenylate synthase
VSNLPLVGARDLAAAVAALAEGRVIAAPGDGGYLLAARHDPATVPGGPVPGSGLPQPPLMVVGHRTQAQALASDWSKEAGMLAYRMWPGPLTLIVPARQRDNGALVYLSMPAARPLRLLCRDTLPVATRPLHRADGSAVIDPREVGQWVGAADVALVIDDGVRRGNGPTVVDCTVSPPVVRHVGALPESFVEGSLLMGARRRRWFSRRSRS